MGVNCSCNTNESELSNEHNKTNMNVTVYPYDAISKYYVPYNNQNNNLSFKNTNFTVTYYTKRDTSQSLYHRTDPGIIHSKKNNKNQPKLKHSNTKTLEINTIIFMCKRVDNINLSFIDGLKDNKSIGDIILPICNIFKDKKYYYIFYKLPHNLIQLNTIFKSSINEENANTIISQLLFYVKQLNELKFQHRNIIPECILINPYTYKVIDMNYENCIHVDEYIRTEENIFINMLYKAPEQLLSYSTYKVDVWSIGIIYFQLLYNDIPYMCASVNALYEQIIEHTIKPPFLRKNKVSVCAYQLCDSMIVFDHNERMPAKDFYKHPLFSMSNSNSIYYKAIAAYHPRFHRLVNSKKEMFDIYSICVYCNVHNKYEAELIFNYIKDSENEYIYLNNIKELLELYYIDSEEINNYLDNTRCKDHSISMYLDSIKDNVPDKIDLFQYSVISCNLTIQMIYDLLKVFKCRIENDGTISIDYLIECFEVNDDDANKLRSAIERNMVTHGNQFNEINILDLIDLLISGYEKCICSSDWYVYIKEISINKTCQNHYFKFLKLLQHSANVEKIYEDLKVKYHNNNKRSICKKYRKYKLRKEKIEQQSFKMPDESEILEIQSDTIKTINSTPNHAQMIKLKEFLRAKIKKQMDESINKQNFQQADSDLEKVEYSDYFVKDSINVEEEKDKEQDNRSDEEYEYKQYTLIHE